MRLEDVKRMAVIGAGLMGHNIVLAYAFAGFQVILNDLSQSILKNASERIKSNLGILARNDLIAKESIKSVLERITTNCNLEKTVGNADFVTEAVAEDVNVKRKLYNKIDQLSPNHTIFASNTSSLLLSQFGSETKRKDKLIITHWFNPSHIVPVVEVVKGEKTSEQTVNLTYAILKKAGKIPIKIYKEIPGFIVNRVGTVAFCEVCSLLEQGIASPEDIDLAIKGSFGFRLACLGPLEICDLGGIDLHYKAIKNILKTTYRSAEVPSVIQEMVKNGDLGLKTGKGFYNYDNKNDKKVIEGRDRRFLQLLKTFYG
jgi:3-hydroxybutyryl-CoA dehydrogenase